MYTSFNTQCMLLDEYSQKIWQKTWCVRDTHVLGNRLEVRISRWAYDTYYIHLDGGFHSVNNPKLGSPPSWLKLGYRAV